MKAADLSAEIADRVRAAAAGGQQLDICGRGSKEFIGRRVWGEKPGKRLEVAGHSGIVDYQPRELVISLRAGTPLAEIEAVLAEEQQMLPFEPPFVAGGSIGGTLACHLSGPARPWQGSIRDAVLGVRLINGRGELLRFGGKVIKNVAGYDVSRLQAGAMGTLGVLTEVNLRVISRHEASLTLVRPMRAGEAVLEMNRLCGQPLPLNGACWLDQQLYLRLEGAASAVEQAAVALGGDRLGEGSPFWQDLRDQRLSFFDGDKPLWRFSLRPSAEPLDIAGEWLIDWAGSQRWYRGEVEDPALLQQLAAEAGGQVSLFRGGERDGEVFHPPSEQYRKLLQAVKLAFDPASILNPGRLYSWL